MKMEGNVHGEFDHPGFRFHPTEEELLGFYLKKKVEGQQFSSNIIGTVDLYRYDPWQLPDVASVREREWFFFVPRDKKCTAARRSRLTVSGYWKTTGSDRPIRNRLFECIGLKKTLVFYRGKAPRGEKTDWIMNEYRMPDFCLKIKKELVLCRIHRKATPPKRLEKRAMAAGEEFLNASAPSNSLNFHHDYKLMNNESECTGGGLSSANIGNGEEVLGRMNTLKEIKRKLPLLQVPMSCMDKLLSQAIVSPWTDNSWTPSILLCTPKEDWNTI